MTDPETPLSPEEAKRRASIRYILRRRGRANKARANSGAVVKSWAEFGEVNFKPDGDSGWGRYLSAVVVIGLLVALPFAYSAHDPEGYEFASVWGIVLASVVGIILLIGAAAFAVVVLSSIWRGLSALFSGR
tara:strand:+ start:1260 stop:1655 length:396 start_codon:yes stop_codon:yes gene_type:complete